MALPGVRNTLCLFEPYPRAEWGIYSYLLDSEEDDPPLESILPQELVNLLDAAYKYPPALALSRERAFDMSGHNVERAAYFNQISELIRGYLERCRENRFLISQVVRSHGDAFKGRYHWIVAYHSKQKSLDFVTDEYYVLTAPANCFELSAGQLEWLDRSQ